MSRCQGGFDQFYTNTVDVENQGSPVDNGQFYEDLQGFTYGNCRISLISSMCIVVKSFPFTGLRLTQDSKNTEDSKGDSESIYGTNPEPVHAVDGRNPAPPGMQQTL